MFKAFKKLFPFLSAAIVIGSLVLVASCTRSPYPDPSAALREVEVPVLEDTLPLDGLADAIQQEVQLLQTRKANSTTPRDLHFGSRVVSEESYLASLQALAAFIRTSNDSSSVMTYIAAHFRFFEVYGKAKWGDVLITGYFEPVINGSRQRTPQYSQALYRSPKDLLKLDVKKFDAGLENPRALRARVEGDEVSPYFDRAAIDERGVLANRDLEICWVDPIDAFFLQIQGSGRVILPDGHEIRLVYSDKNGHPYKPIGKFLSDKIELSALSMQSIDDYLRKLPHSDAQAILNKNPSYVFFNTSSRDAVTSLGVEATAGRTIATDKKYFAKGALAFLKYSAKGSGGSARSGTRFVLDQDVGGAITGPGRVDLFFGAGKTAGAAAGGMKTNGALYYLVPR